MSFLDLRDAYVTRFAGISGVRSSSAVDPSWNEAELQRTGSQPTPEVLVACLGATAVEDGDAYASPTARFSFVATVISRAGDAERLGKDSPGDMAAAIASRVFFELVSGDDFADHMGGTTEPELANVTDAALARAGRFVWVVAWEAEAELDASSSLVLVPLERIHTEHDTNGPDGNPDGIVDHESEISYV